MKTVKKLYFIAMVTFILSACATAPEGGENPTEVPSGTMTPISQEQPIKDHLQMLQMIHQAVKSDENYGAQVQVQNDVTYMQTVLGLDPSWYDAAIAEYPLLMTEADTFIILHPTEGNATKVEEALQNYRDYLIHDSAQYPANMLKIQQSVVQSVGDYVCYIILNSPENVIRTIEDVISGRIQVTLWTELEKAVQVLESYVTPFVYPTRAVHSDIKLLAQYLDEELKIDKAWLKEIYIMSSEKKEPFDLIVVADTSDGNAEKVQQALTEYKNTLVTKYAGKPEEVRMSAAVVERVGDFVCFSLLGGKLDDPATLGLSKRGAC